MTRTGIRRQICEYPFCYLLISVLFSILALKYLSFTPFSSSNRQAQDRAHRIGQTREVQVFRLVTEDSIEQKVVERAQQKLKLDAMVVQQGRLKEKDKLSGDELLDAVRFGADKIFKSKDSSITDDDVSMLIFVSRYIIQIDVYNLT